MHTRDFFMQNFPLFKLWEILLCFILLICNFLKVFFKNHPKQNKVSHFQTFNSFLIFQTFVQFIYAFTQKGHRHFKVLLALVELLVSRGWPQIFLLLHYVPSICAYDNLQN